MSSVRFGVSVRFFAASIINRILLVALACAAALAQTTTGLPPFSTIHDSLYDDVKVNDGSILLKLPIRTKAGVIPFSYSLVSNVAIGINSGGGLQVSPQWAPNTTAGLSPGSKCFQLMTSDWRLNWP